MNKILEEWHKNHLEHFYSGSYETKELSEFLGVSTRTIQRWIKGKGYPKEYQVARIQEYLENNA